jgi:hypothetical protein
MTITVSSTVPFNFMIPRLCLSRILNLMNPKTYNAAKEFMDKTKLDQIEVSITIDGNVEQLSSSNKSLFNDIVR